MSDIGGIKPYTPTHTQTLDQVHQEFGTNAIGFGKTRSLRVDTTKGKVLYQNVGNPCCCCCKDPTAAAQKRADGAAYVKHAIDNQHGKGVGDEVFRHLKLSGDKVDRGDLDKIKALLGRHSESLVKQATVATMESSQDSLQWNQRPQLMVAMGQGAIGRLDQIQLYSDSFSNCMPVILYNENTKVGGLFHVPAPSVDHSDGDALQYREGVRDALEEMIDLVQPTQIIVKPGRHGQDLGLVATSTDNKASKVADDMRAIAKNLDFDPDCVEFHEDDASGTVLVTGGFTGGVAISGNDMKNAGAINLLRNPLPSNMTDKAVTWSFVEDDDYEVLDDDSKFL